MSIFTKKEATKNSIANRKLVYGVGVNDAWYMVACRVEGKQVLCPYYKKWKNMLLRAYSPIIN